ncbi:hypothetical protein GUITHDRAFT_103081 [Guillardia theta CCMP2712]|uniref:Uncharacterized protein n=1 Tax=Guillardia theta (strain CCMP2712) TaxID=905079 RepID=L1JRG5_GUITC|nr:hypothetical protein GUITHDRAFT_103081 [Guillardia theta CCMP2712]EKX51161.1 hypothetical protein GUITHDRAFT_103081 [Guillardia theta CCMP2712]|eukprot:XP_005838141.1 hypothetical protein GUITHDRAFT_103081 [Guillardia theta CCMP2712]
MPQLARSVVTNIFTRADAALAESRDGFPFSQAKYAVRCVKYAGTTSIGKRAFALGDSAVTLTDRVIEAGMETQYYASAETFVKERVAPKLRATREATVATIKAARALPHNTSNYVVCKYEDVKSGVIIRYNKTKMIIVCRVNGVWIRVKLFFSSGYDLLNNFINSIYSTFMSAKSKAVNLFDSLKQIVISTRFQITMFAQNSWKTVTMRIDRYSAYLPFIQKQNQPAAIEEQEQEQEQESMPSPVSSQITIRSNGPASSQNLIVEDIMSQRFGRSQAGATKLEQASDLPATSSHETASRSSPASLTPSDMMMAISPALRLNVSSLCNSSTEAEAYENPPPLESEPQELDEAPVFNAERRGGLWVPSPIISERKSHTDSAKKLKREEGDEDEAGDQADENTFTQRPIKFKIQASGNSKTSRKKKGKTSSKAQEPIQVFNF